ncbi:GNAT family N-acetyltransferase [Priestia koreensis]|uniref:GNAT family N-acetyltransferase n=1 Tax=Priestia koreensis TaxID=284581 RepID=UPI0028F6D0AB|nr:GNAT family N-acetyltransferase [Priestia koreensis]
MELTLIPSMWETNQLIVRDLRKEEIEDVQALYLQGSYLGEWDGRTYDSDYITQCFTTGDLPPDGSKDHFKIQVLRMKETNKITGLLTTYHGHPSPEVFYITYFYLDQRLQSQGLGREAMEKLLQCVKETNYTEIRANVAIKNWPALRFWTSLGLDRIQGVFGDRTHDSHSFADIELVKKL